MNPFKMFTLKWWQAGLFKVGLLALGIAIGASWHEYFSSYVFILTIVAVGCLASLCHLPVIECQQGSVICHTFGQVGF